MHIIKERIRKRQVIYLIIENVLALFFLFFPKTKIENKIKTRIAECVFKCDSSEIYLYKSGRSALCGLLEGLRGSFPEISVVYIPDYVCNIVGASCESVGFKTVIYPTSAEFIPLWDELDKIIENDHFPVVIFCSLFGSIPLQTNGAKEFEIKYPNCFIIADECQNMIPRSPIIPGKNRAIVFSFNDKTCPGVMGGGIVFSKSTSIKPKIWYVSNKIKIFTIFGLINRWVQKLLKEIVHIIIIISKKNIIYRYSFLPEYSDFASYHYDLTPEYIYKISAAWAYVSLIFLDRYKRIRHDNAKVLLNKLKCFVGYNQKLLSSDPPYLPVSPNCSIKGNIYPVPVKAPYCDIINRDVCGRKQVALKNNITYVCYNFNSVIISQITSRHSITDNRIFHCMAKTAQKAGCQSEVIGPAFKSSVYEDIRLCACPVVKKKIKLKNIIFIHLALFLKAVKSQSSIFHFHDPDLIVFGVLLKFMGKKIIYDVHDDYELAIKDRINKNNLIKNIVSKLWWNIEIICARIFDGIIVADRHLEKKFIKCNPVLLGNYPRLDFTPEANPDNEETFNLIYVGGVTRERGLEMLFRAIQILHDIDLRLHIIGSCSDMLLLDMLKSDKRIILHGRVLWTELHKYYEKSHLGLALYQPLESFRYYPGENAVKVVEYMAAGIPVICSDFPGLKAFSEAAGCGITVKPDDPAEIAKKIKLFIDDHELCKKLGKQGRYLFQREYNWEKHEQKLVDLYKKILKINEL